jgi:hypothetical protein
MKFILTAMLFAASFFLPAAYDMSVPYPDSSAPPLAAVKDMPFPFPDSSEPPPLQLIAQIPA